MSRDMPSFTRQNRPEKVKEIYRALKREHPDMPAEMKARIAARQGKPGRQPQGPPYKAPIKPWKAKKKLAKVLTTKAREHIAPKNFVFPKKEAYPIHDAAHARNALARVSQFGSPSEKARVRAAVSKRYPGIEVENKKTAALIGLYNLLVKG